MATSTLLRLLLLTTVAITLGSAVCTRYGNISVSDALSSADSSSCLSGTIPCKTLEYAMSKVANCTYVSVNFSRPATLNAPISVQNVSGLILTAEVTNQMILCSKGAGLRFEAVRDIQILGLYWSQCSISHVYPSSLSNGNGQRSSGIVFIDSTDVTVRGNTFTSSYGSGLSLYNVGGTVTIQGCFFVNNTVIECSRQNCNQTSQGLHIELGFYNSANGLLSLQNSDAFINIVDSSFVQNENPYSGPQSPSLEYGDSFDGGKGGGLAIVIGGNSTGNTIKIMNCSFVNNTALYGAGIAVIVTEEAKSNQVVICQSTQFRFNSAAQAGGGMLLAITTSAGFPNNSITVSASFISNSASLGGALACFSAYQVYLSQRNALTITQSLFKTNMASRGGSALSLVTLPRVNEGSYPLAISINQSNITLNTISAFSTSSSSAVVGVGAVYVELSALTVNNVLFSQNVGTALFLSSSFVTLQGNVEFKNNYAIDGAGVYLSGVSWMKITRGLELKFENNYALQYGGAVYHEFPLPGSAGEQWDCIIQYENDSVPMKNWSVNVSFTNNTAQSGGSSIYLSNPESCIREEDNPPFTNKMYSFLGSTTSEQISYPPAAIYLNQASRKFWEGQSLQLSAYAYTYLNRSVSDSGQVVVDYSQASTKLSLGGNRAIQFNSTQSSDLYVTGPLYADEDNNTYTAEIIVHSSQHPLAITKITFNITRCPFGCPYNASLKVCKCKSNSAVQCENDVCCIKYGYWYGELQTSTGHAYEGDVCPRGFCSYNGNGLCPENAKCPFISGYCKLPQTEDGICANDRGGAFCSYCADGNSFTYAGIKCIEDSKCSPEYQVVLVLVIFLYWAVLTGIIIAALKFKFRVGSGRLYCVLYYFSIINYFVGNNYPTAFLQVSVDTITGIVLQPRFIGSIDICVSKGISPIQVVALNYIHPLFFLIFVSGIIFLARYIKSIANLKSTSQAVCLLILLSHTSLVETSITILRPMVFSDLVDSYVSIQPATKYFDLKDHFPYALIALVVLLINIPISLLLFAAPMLSRFEFFKLDKIKPILDEFQGCYKDEYRCFAGFYLVIRELIYVISLFPGLKVYGAIYTYQWVSIIAVIIHAMVQPYKEKWLNILDTVLLSNLVAVSLLFGGTAYTLFGQNGQSRNFHVFLVHIFVLMPIIYALGLGIYALVIQLRKYFKSKKSVDLNGSPSSQPEVHELGLRESQNSGKDTSEIKVPANLSPENQSSGKGSSGKGSSGKGSSGKGSSGKGSSSGQGSSGEHLPDESNACIVVNYIQERRDSVIFDTVRTDTTDSSFSLT